MDFDDLRRRRLFRQSSPREVRQSSLHLDMRLLEDEKELRELLGRYGYDAEVALTVVGADRPA